MEKGIILQNINNLRSNSMPGTGIHGLPRRSKLCRPLKYKWNKHAIIMGNSVWSSAIISVHNIAICTVLLLN